MAPADRGNSWFILFIENAEYDSFNILVLIDRAEVIQTNASALETAVLGHCGYARDEIIASFSVLGPHSQLLVVTALQLCVHLRDIETSPRPTEPNLWGYGSNVVTVTFQEKIVRAAV